MSEPILCVVGPTASGKSGLSVALAHALGGEVVSADSVQIYRRFDIGSAKLGVSRQGGVQHHLLDVLDPLETYDAARFVEAADVVLADIRARGRTPIVCGGSFLWVRALLFGLAAAPPADAGLRQEYKRLAEQHGRSYLHERLKSVDQRSYEKLNPNDFVRVSRALEVYELTGRTLSQVQAEHGFRQARFPAALVGVDHPRAKLHERISERTRGMLEAGLVDEVKGLLDDGLSEAPALRSIGYRQVAEAIQGPETESVEALQMSIDQATRGFVRHQMTWLRRQPVRWLCPSDQGAFVEEQLACRTRAAAP